MRQYFLLIIFIIEVLSIYPQSFQRFELPTEVSTPWEVLYGPDDFIWLTESGGKVSRIDPSNGNKTVIYTANNYFGGSPLENSPPLP